LRDSWLPWVFEDHHGRNCSGPHPGWLVRLSGCCSSLVAVPSRLACKADLRFLHLTSSSIC
jgi:hypothetical protein